jgi:septal ring factor EnvC (AmiA/AmiB activator)
MMIIFITKAERKNIMATLQDVKDKIDAVKADLIAEKGEVQTAISALKAQIIALQELLNSGSNVTPADLDALVSSLDQISVGVKDISEPSLS